MKAKNIRTKREAQQLAKSMSAKFEKEGDKKWHVYKEINGEKEYLDIDGTFSAKRSEKKAPNVNLSGCSVLSSIDEVTGEKKPKLIWDKYGKNAGKLEGFIEAANSVQPIRIDSIKDTAVCDKNALTLYPLADAHIGLLSHAAECGESWDLKIAQATYTAVFSRLVGMSRPSKYAIVASLGDLTHYDGAKAVTNASGHLLDVDSRWAKMYKIAFAILCNSIAAVAARHEQVIIMLAQGNHDEVTSQALSHALGVMYRDSDRITVVDNTNPFMYHKHGRNLLGITHGNIKGINNLPAIMEKDNFGNMYDVKNKYWYIGHRHQRELRSFPGGYIETFPSMCKADSWSHRSGFRSQPELHSIVIDKNDGEISRNIVRY